MTRYVKFINVTGVESAPVNYEKDGVTIYNFNKAPEIMFKYGYKPLVEAEREDGKKYRVTYEEYETQIKEILEEIVPDPEEEARKERERINMLSLTKREVFLALYRDKGITPDQLRAQIQDTEAQIEFDYAELYYRGNPLIDSIGAMLGYTSEQLDYLFMNKEFPKVQEEEE